MSWIQEWTLDPTTLSAHHFNLDLQVPAKNAVWFLETVRFLPVSLRVSCFFVGFEWEKGAVRKSI